ncbi:MAG: RNA polymerase sigma factor [Nannocystaceae bacterium]|jgi:RNA polymerase sigma-70 factor (ECF subfamily)
MATDFELLDRWRAGDQHAGSELFERYFDAVYDYISTKAPANHDDLVQRTMMAALEGRDRIRGEFAAYLFGTATRIVYGEYRKRLQDAERQVDFGVTSAFDLAPGPSSVLSARAERTLLVAALRQIPLDFQVAVELHHLHGLSGAAIATALEVPEGTVRSRIRRGLTQLREKLAALESDPVRAQQALRALGIDPDEGSVATLRKIAAGAERESDEFDAPG